MFSRHPSKTSAPPFLLAPPKKVDIHMSASRKDPNHDGQSAANTDYYAAACKTSVSCDNRGFKTDYCNPRPPNNGFSPCNDYEDCQCPQPLSRVCLHISDGSERSGCCLCER